MGFKSRRRKIRQGKKTRKAQSRKAREATEAAAAKTPVPKSFVFRKGDVGRTVKDLVHDLRRVMEPNTAPRLRERSNNTMRDFKDAAIAMGVTHLLALSTGEATGATFLRIGRVPHGPTLSFRVRQFSLATDVQRLLSKQPRPPGPEFRNAPLVVLNNFAAGGAPGRLVSATLQNMFPPISVETVRLKDCRRVVLFHYDAERESVMFRHYLVTAAPSGVNKNLRRIVQGRPLAASTMRRAGDIADVVLGPAAASESEASDVEECKVALPQDFVGSGNVAASSAAEKSTVRLIELGPRIELALVRVQEELFDGKVIIGAAAAPGEDEKKPKKKKKGKGGEIDAMKEAEEAEDDDREWYRKEIGEEPDEEFMAAAVKAKVKVKVERDGKAAKANAGKIKVAGKQKKKVRFPKVLAKPKKEKKSDAPNAKKRKTAEGDDGMADGAD